ncbi:hypothetical protein [Actinophytocola algeriensis]|uniref:Glycosyltransferase involved in cell wall biosynthesis n=1 Tax=Actinophytocola algeriensis TaxID=1768010 RepID=A0A7W7Q6L0_9PSEU|nr:hypothetical protein [Actinophytocola algeriensis]MBB4907669.1 glycosyltransferase involved in cell wall biosynthesis [Actinophytocola algeriensis]MBE1479699.1 glycosyltransferase involved in cell wall biosynthesis [Actinophytocola algeriensis]
MTTAEPGRLAASVHHHGRHDALIDTPPHAAPGKVDAIIVPTARSAKEMAYAVNLAKRLGCVLVALCSRWSIFTEVVKVARPFGTEVIVIDARRLPPGVLPRFSTDRLLAGTRFYRTTDTSQKRNLGLLIARLSGWERVAFLDDDITIPEPSDLKVAAGLTDRYAGVGLQIDPRSPSFPDNSVVCHAYRDAGGDQGMFVGGGALVVGSASMTSFFPNIYNEDWFFLLGEDNLRPVTMVGRALQRPYDPYEDGSRAQVEELGDCLAEGLFWLFDNGGSIQDADAVFWQSFLARRISFIADVVAMVNRMPGGGGKRLRMLAALKAARDRSERIKPDLCTQFVARWRNDRVTWRNHVDELQERHRVKNAEKVLTTLGLTGQSRYLSS